VPPIERYVRAKRFLGVFGGERPLREAAACIAVSPAEMEHYRRAGVAEERIRVIPNGIRTDEYERLPSVGTFRRAYDLGDGPLVVFVGKITPRKGVDVLLRALETMSPAVRLAVVGNFMMNEDKLRRLVEALGLGRRVLFTGLLLGKEKLAAYVDADVVAYPCIDEIFGLVPAEALMCGSPVVVCADSGCGEIVRTSGGGRLVPYGDPTALAEALRELLEDPERRAELATRGREYVARFLDWEQVGERTQTLYREVIGGTFADRIWGS
jgi:glycosyltransferase involved in cell wall biosynthesis